jgi:hypothetical protein
MRSYAAMGAIEPCNSLGSQKARGPQAVFQDIRNHRAISKVLEGPKGRYGHLRAIEYHNVSGAMGPWRFSVHGVPYGHKRPGPQGIMGP